MNTAMPHEDAIAGVVLAGGKSSRMGRDKAALRYGERTLLEHMGALLHEAGATEVYISHPDYIADELPGHGPLSGIHTTLKELLGRHTHLLYVPVDMPHLSAPLLRQICETPPTCEAVRFSGYALPFRLQVTDTHLALLEKILKEEARHALKSFQSRLSLTELEVPPAQAPLFANINTPQEWHAITQGAVA